MVDQQALAAVKGVYGEKIAAALNEIAWAVRHGMPRLAGLRC
jgi:hypothetical protein